MCACSATSVMSDSLQPHGPPGSSVHGIFQARILEWVAISPSSDKVWSEWSEQSEVAQSCPTLCDPMDCSLPGSPIYGIFQARVLEWLPVPSPIYLPTHGLLDCFHFIVITSNAWRYTCLFEPTEKMIKGELRYFQGESSFTEVLTVAPNFTVHTLIRMLILSWDLQMAEWCPPKDRSTVWPLGPVDIALFGKGWWGGAKMAEK